MNLMKRLIPALLTLLWATGGAIGADTTARKPKDCPGKQNKFIPAGYRILLIFIILLSVGTIYAQTSDETPSLEYPDYWEYSDLGGVTLDAFARLMFFPLQSDIGVGEYVLWHLLTLRMGLGLGYNHELKKGILSPGAYFDFGFSPLLLLFDSSEDEPTEGDAIDPFLVDIGIRINNQFKWNNIDIRPFYGISYYFGEFLFHQFGVFVGIKKIGFEYTYLSNAFRETAIFHRISVMFHVH